MIKNILIMIGEDFFLLDMLIKYNYKLNNEVCKIIICGPDSVILKEYYLDKNFLEKDIITTFNTNVEYRLNKNNTFLYDEITCSIIFCKKILNNLLKDYKYNEVPNIYFFVKNKELERVTKISSKMLNTFPIIKIVYKTEKISEEEKEEEKELFKLFSDFYIK